MAIFNPSNQLLQIDTGTTRTYLFNPTQSKIQVYANIGEVQVLGQRYFGVTNATPSNPYAAPAIFQLVQYLSTSATTTANLTTAGAPAPVYWTDETFTTVSGISTEAGVGLNGIAGYMMVNTVSLPNLTATLLLGAQIIIQVAGLLMGAYGPTAGTAGANNMIVPSAGTFTSAGVAAGTAPGYRTLGVQLTAISSGLCDVLVTGPDII
jgi:hypothetical protein